MAELEERIYGFMYYINNITFNINVNLFIIAVAFMAFFIFAMLFHRVIRSIFSYIKTNVPRANTKRSTKEVEDNAQ